MLAVWTEITVTSDVSYEISGSLKIYFYILHQPCIQRFEPWMLSFSDILAFVPVSGPT